MSWILKLLAGNSGSWIFAAVLAISATLGASSGAYITAKVKNAEIAAMVHAQDQARIAGLAASADASSQFAAMSNRIAQDLAGALDHTTYLTQTLTREVPIYVTPEIDASYPVPCGLVRVRDAAILRADPAGLAAASCPSDASRSPIAASALSAADVGLIGDYYAVKDERDALRAYANGIQKIWKDYQAKFARPQQE